MDFKLILVTTLLLFLVGCSTVEYKEVLIPIRVEIVKPTRPVFVETDNAATYLVEVLNYVRKLEHVVDVHNGSVNENK